MRESPIRQTGQQSIGAVMFRVAIAAFRALIGFQHPAVDSDGVGQLFGHIRMAGQTAVIHGCLFPGCAVTGFTVPGDFRVRSDAAQRAAGDCIQISGTVHRPTHGERRPHDRKDRDQSRNNPCGR